MVADMIVCQAHATNAAVDEALYAITGGSKNRPSLENGAWPFNQWTLQIQHREIRAGELFQQLMKYAGRVPFLEEGDIPCGGTNISTDYDLDLRHSQNLFR